MFHMFNGKTYTKVNRFLQIQEATVSYTIWFPSQLITFSHRSQFLFLLLQMWTQLSLVTKLYNAVA